jgi:CheY-like chemotaxis protein/anti-sigma regulatory factor (Ser/Thr protein kinase)
MNSILGFAQVLERKAPTPDAQKSIGHILRAGRHLLELINEVLDIARIEANRLSLSSEPVNVSQAVSEAVALIQPLADQRSCTIQDHISAHSTEWVAADRQRLAQVLLNLLANAVKYNKPGGSVTLSCSPFEGHLRISVADTGHGIAAEKMPLLFTPFERIGGEALASEGTGLGLALSRGLMEAMGGHISAESTFGVGSVFHLDLLPAENPQHRLERTRKDGAKPADDGVSASLLYIEDNLANLSLIETILSDRPHIQLQSSLQGRLGFELARQHRPDLILLDLHLPDMTGDEVLRLLKSDMTTRNIPVIVISADATTRHMERILAGGAAAYLTKPLEVDQFLGTVERLLAAKATKS